MPTYYPQDAADVVLFVTVALCCIIGFAAYVAGIYDTLYPLPATPDDDDDFREIPDQAPIAAQHCAKVNAKRDLAHVTSDNLADNYLCPISGLTGAQFKTISEQVARVQP